MKKTLLFTLIVLAFTQLASALDATVSYATFKSPVQNYVEIYMHVAGSTVEFLTISPDEVKAEVEVVILFKQGEDIIKYDKYRLNSPASATPLDFVDMKRYGLANGMYQVEMTMQDVNKTENTKKFKSEITIEFSEEGVQQSDLQLLATMEKATDLEHPFVKMGYQLEPLPYQFYGKNSPNLIFYSEIYNTDKVIGEDFLVSYFIQKLVNDKAETVKIGHKRQKPNAVVPLIVQMDISDLPSGNYELVVEVRNRLNELQSQKTVFFQRSNPFLNVERIELAQVPLDKEFVNKLSAKELEYSLRALTPKIGQADMEHLNTILRKADLSAQRLFLFSYWAQLHPNLPEAAYNKYMEIVRAVDREFKSGFRHGFETDRGFYYLKYGQPDDITRVMDDPVAPPYEVWSYNDFPMTQQGNVRFIFYNPSLAAGDFVLLHSTARGELNNPNWQIELYRDAPNEIEGSDYFEATDMQNNWGRRAGRNFIDY